MDLSNLLVSALNYSDWLLALGIFLAALIAAKFMSLFFKLALSSYAKKTETKFDDAISDSFRKPIMWAIILLGSYFAIKQVAYLQEYLPGILKSLNIVGVFLGAWMVLLLFDAMFIWISEQHDLQTKRVQALSAGISNLIKLFILVIVFIFVIQILGFEVTPLLTSLGIGGLAVALALQETLSNYFAGLSINAGGNIRPGDFVELEDGKQGHVEHVGWRNTRIKLLSNNIIILPNSKFAQSEVTNYSTPIEEQSVLVYCGVSYSSDLELVEKVCIEVGKDIQKKVEGAVDDHTPAVRFYEFGDSNINLKVILRVKDFVSRYLLIHEFIKALKKRFDEEKIEIAFPTRIVYERD